MGEWSTKPTIGKQDQARIDQLNQALIDGRISAAEYEAGKNAILAEPTPDPEPTKPTGSASDVFRKLTIGTAAVVVVILGMLGWNALNGPTLENQEKHVIPACQDSLKKRLRDPDSAQFSAELVTHRNETAEGKLEYRATGIVRARNGFGGMVANAYTCTASYNTFYEEVTAYASLVEE